MPKVKLSKDDIRLIRYWLSVELDMDANYEDEEGLAFVASVLKLDSRLAKKEAK